jgi:hypothetical protein
MKKPVIAITHLKQDDFSNPDQIIKTIVAA